MSFSQVFECFVNESPICVMMRATLENVFSSERLDSVFERTAQRQHTSELLFSSVADMMASVVCRIHPSINSAYKARAERLGVSVKAVYDKLQGIEPQVSRELVRETAKHVASLVQQTKAPLASPLPGYRVKIVDGNHLRRTDRRIGELRKGNVAPLPGKSLVVLDAQLQLAIDVIPCEDGHANERALFPDLFPLIERRDVWVGDRNFCTTGLLFQFFTKSAYFVVRQHRTALHWELKGRRQRVGTVKTGVVYEQSMRIEDEDGNQRVIRRITVKLGESTRDGDQEIHILTNLPKKVGALKIAELYQDRWTIETAFQRLAENLNGEINTMGYPKAALFAFCIALVAYNIVTVIRAAIGAVHGASAAERTSAYYMADEIAQTYRGMMIAVPPAFWTKRYANLSARQIAKVLVEIAGHIALDKYRTNRWSKKKKENKTKHTRRKHVSTARLIEHRIPILTLH